MRLGRIAAVLACAAAGLGLAGCSGLEEIEKLAVQDVTVNTVRDGTYQGSQSNFPVTAKVKVTVQGGRITDIELLRHFHGPDHGADAILDRVVASQSLRVDAVSGATYSSKVVLKAVEAALRQGL